MQIGKIYALLEADIRMKPQVDKVDLENISAHADILTKPHMRNPHSQL